jgi:hypothetical protein
MILVEIRHDKVKMVLVYTFDKINTLKTIL